MSSPTVLYLVIGVAVLGLLIYRQLVARPVQGSQRLVLAAIFGAARAATVRIWLRDGRASARQR